MLRSDHSWGHGVIYGIRDLPELINQGNQSKKVGDCEVLEASRRGFADHQAQHRTQIVTGDVDEESFENVLTASQVYSSHSTRFVAMGEWPF
ncbi:MAG TPA: hypothetical protein VE422_09700 [Terriglobia bacterium]|nr:hypothetical protein [Terriglobia bacterium]